MHAGKLASAWHSKRLRATMETMVQAAKKPEWLKKSLWW
jgi:hypothetical protein